MSLSYDLEMKLSTAPGPNSVLIENFRNAPELRDLARAKPEVYILGMEQLGAQKATQTADDFPSHHDGGSSRADAEEEAPFQHLWTCGRTPIPCHQPVL